jgi:hypothetical protein
MHWLRGLAVVAALALVGCGRGKVAQPEVAEDTQTRLPDKVDVNLADWLARPRPELAKMAEEAAGTVAHQRKSAADEHESATAGATT